MNAMACDTRFVSEGSSALQASPVRLRLVEGGLSRPAVAKPSSTTSSAREIAPRQASLGARLALPLVALGMTVALLVASLLMDTAAASGRASAFAQVGTEAVTVMPGDSLWSLAEEHPVDGASTAEVVDFISQENGLSSSNLSIGQSVYVPVS